MVFYYTCGYNSVSHHNGIIHTQYDGLRLKFTASRRATTRAARYFIDRCSMHVAESVNIHSVRQLFCIHLSVFICVTLLNELWQAEMNPQVTSMARGIGIWTIFLLLGTNAYIFAWNTFTYLLFRWALGSLLESFINTLSKRSATHLRAVWERRIDDYGFCRSFATKLSLFYSE